MIKALLFSVSSLGLIRAFPEVTFDVSPTICKDDWNVIRHQSFFQLRSEDANSAKMMIMMMMA